jgi:predicted transcriptional regulator
MEPVAPESSIESEVENLTIRLSGDAMKRVRALASRRGISINEYMRRAISTEAFFLERSLRGARIYVEEAGRTTKEVVFP